MLKVGLEITYSLVHATNTHGWLQMVDEYSVENDLCPVIAILFCMYSLINRVNLIKWVHVAFIGKLK